MRRTWLVVSMLALLAGTAGGAAAALLVVPDDFPSIQAALDAAASGDSVMIRAGTYAESLALAGKDLTLFGESGAEATVVTGGQTRRVLDLGAGVTAGTVLSDLTFRDGGGGDRGAGIGSTAPPRHIRRCRFVANVAFCWTCDTFGGGLAAGSGSTSVIEDCQFTDNVALIDHLWTTGFGGAIYAGPDRASRSGARPSAAMPLAFEGGVGGAVVRRRRAWQRSRTACSTGTGAGAGTVFSEEHRGPAFHLHRQPGFVWNRDLLPGHLSHHRERLFDNECGGASESGGAILVEGSGHVGNNTIAFNHGFCPRRGSSPGPWPGSPSATTSWR
jgi:hypothetical protein